MSEWIETDEPDGEHLFPGGSRDAAPDGIRKHALPRLTRMVSAMCEWGSPGEDCFLGDVRFMAVEFSASRDAGFYVQILNEPGEPVLAEAVSPAMHPELRDRIGLTERSALRAMGYRVGGPARNFQKERKADGPEAAGALAAELLDILIDVFGYRGRQPLVVHRQSDARYVVDRVFRGFCADDVRKMLAAAGCAVAELASDRLPAGVPRDLRERMLIVERPFPFSVFLDSPVKGNSSACQVAAFSSELEGTRRVPDSVAVAASRFVRFARLARNPTGNLALLLDLSLVGITMEGFLTSLNTWINVHGAVLKMLRSLGRKSGRSRSTTKAPSRKQRSPGRRPRPAKRPN